MNPFRSASASIPSTPTLAALAIGLVLSLAGKPAFAQATIDHTKALAGNVTPGDAAGYPITISRPGHYKLMSNLTVPAGSKGIEATVPNVTLDLNGFTVSGPGSCTNNGATTTCTGQSGLSEGVELRTASAVRNGTVEGFGRGVYLDGGSSAENLMLRHNHVAGLVVRADSALPLLVTGVRAMLNGSSGLSIGSRALVSGSLVALNGGSGISGSGHSARVVSSVSYGNGLRGYYGVTLQDSQAVTNGQSSQIYVKSAGGNVENGVVF